MAIFDRWCAGVLLALAMASAPAVAQQVLPHRIGADTRMLDLTGALGVIEDDDSSLTAAQAAARADSGNIRVEAHPQGPIFRRNSDNTLWIRLDVLADPAAPADWVLVVGWPIHEHVQLFTQAADGSWTGSAPSGTAVAFTQRPVNDRNFAFRVRIPPGQRTAMLLRIQDSGEAPITAELWQAGALRDSEKTTEGLYFLYFGLFGGMLLYNLLLFVVVRDRRYLIYLGFITSVAIAVAGNTGIGARYVWGDWGFWWNNRATNLGYSVLMVFSVAFTRRILSTRRRLPRGDKVLLGIAWMAALAATAAATLPKHMGDALLLPAAFAMGVTTTGFSILGVIRRWPGAAYFCAACVSFQLAAVIGAARFFTPLPWPVTVPGAVAFGSALEMILLSLALADRINEERRQKERAQAQSMAILRASQALSSETRMDRLHARLCQVMADVTGASAVHFVLYDADSRQWSVFAPGAGAERISADEAAARGLLPLSALRVVEELQQPIVVEDALTDARFRQDPAFAGAARCSLLALPIFLHGALTAVLLLENRSRRGAFSELALGAVEAVAGPLAVSLENVQLYEHLERRVADQTRELRETQRELVATARRAGRAEVANNVLHNVGNVLNSVNTSAEVVSSRIRESRTQGLARAVDLMNEHAGSIGEFISKDPRGKTLPGYLNKLVEELAREREDVVSELDRLMNSVNHIKAVVAMQQSHAGASSVLEMVRPADLLEEALHMSADATVRHEVTVLRQCDEVPALLLDKPRVLQVLVNLIGNATQAMESVPRESRRIAVSCGLVLDDRERLRIAVRDEGEGIPPENLARIFSHGFTTREQGHGFGLHSCALAALEMGGTLVAHSDGVGRGAVFTLDLPVSRAEQLQ
jgi:signal transduction histidine kinase